MTVLLDAESTIKPGLVLGGKYRVESVLGMGGMGVVVAARHVTLNTRFALKLLRREALKEPESVERFLREARAAVKLRSQHCVQVIDVGKLEDGAPYMVMELLVGQDLADLVAQSGARSPAEAVDYILQACEGIAEAHSFGIIHRDIKPQNLFLTRGVDGMPLVKVLDFGLAKSTKMSPEARALTQTTAVMGSPMYMSPEQMRASREVDARSDTWSLGVCLYELLTGRTPFEGATFPELCSMVLNEAPTPMPSDIPRGLSRVIARCLQKDPRRRYADVAELAKALEEFASAPGAAGRIRAVLDTPRAVLESLPPVPMSDPNAETKAVASAETTKRRRQGASRGMRAAPWGAFLGALVVVGTVGGVAIARSRHAVVAPASLSTAPALVATNAPAAVTAPLPQTALVSIAPTPPAAVPPSNGNAEPTANKPTRAKSVSSHRPPSSSKPSAPVLTPKTTEF